MVAPAEYGRPSVVADAGVVAQVARFASQFYDGLKAGDVIITGSVIAPITIEPDETAFGHALDPVSEVIVRFTR